MSKKYRIYCNDEEIYKIVWSDIAPTSCPDNILHSVDLNKIDLLDISEEVFRININKTSNNINFKRLVRFSYDPQSTSIFRRVKALVYKVGSIINFNLQIYNITENIELLNVILDNTNQEKTIEVGLINVLPASIESIIEISIKINNSISDGSMVYLDEVIFYT